MRNPEGTCSIVTFAYSRWMEPEEPDPDGQQFAAIKRYLSENPKIKFLWYDAVRNRTPHSRPSRAPSPDPVAAQVCCHC